MDLTTLLSPDCTKCAVAVTSKKKALELLGHMAAPRLNPLNAFEVFESLLARERLGSTGIGLGIAIPHGRVSAGSKPVAILLSLADPVDFDAIDNQPVDLIFALLVPDQQHEQHLQTLAAVAQRLNDKQCTRAMRDATTDMELYQAFTACN